MGKREHLRKNVIKNVQLFRVRQKQAAESDIEQLKKRQYRELQDILSPFWAWRTPNH